MIHVVIAVDGFQHGSGPFYPKCVVVKEVKTGYEQRVILNLPDDALNAFKHSSEVARTYSVQQKLHGLRPEQRGLPSFAVPGIIGEVVHKASDQCYAGGAVCYTKGNNVIPIVNEFKDRSCLFLSRVINVEEIGCPPLKELGLAKRPIYTAKKASAIAEWIRVTHLS